MKCKLCHCPTVDIVYTGPIRVGKNQITPDSVDVFQCAECGVLWHEAIDDFKRFYGSVTYRSFMGEQASLEEYCRLHDAAVLAKLSYTGTEVYRNKRFLEVGCGGGGFSDFIRGVAKNIVLIEPTEEYQAQLRVNGYEVYSYMKDAEAKHLGQVDILVSFDVIEHVENPSEFLEQVFQLLAPGGTAYIGTPTDYPVLRKLLGQKFDQFVFSLQHPWVFSAKSLRLLAQQAGFPDCQVQFHQLYGLGNLLMWLRDATPQGDVQMDFLPSALEATYKAELAKPDTAEYLVLVVNKS